MKKIFSILFILLFIIIGCDNSSGPDSSITSGETTINTLEENNKFSGFSFAQGGKIELPNEKNIDPDILLLVLRNEDGDVRGVCFCSSNDKKTGFLLLEQKNDSAAALNYYNNLIEIPDTNYSNYATLVIVDKYQILAVKTADDKYGKILILNADVYTYPDNPLRCYGEARFKWMYQPNGSRIFK
ncbi:MAG: hypothetical protein ABFD00_00945 [Chloroherpetonaceae bacterium]|nr:hypothetical protein [bacterium]